MNADKYRKYVLAQRPRYGVPTPSIFKLTAQDVPEPGSGQVRVRTAWLSMDPNVYGRVAKVSSHYQPIDLGSVMPGAAVGYVEASRHPGFREGDLVIGAWGWQTHHISDGSDLVKADPEVERPSHHLTAFGLSAFAAYIAVCENLDLQKGETISFGAAVGGLGQMVGQLARQRGARVIAITSGPEKCRIATERLGFDVCIDRTADKAIERISAEFAKSGVDAVVMAVGPGGLKLALPHFRRGGRVAVCGMIGSYAADTSASRDSMGFLLQEINQQRLSIFGVVAADHVGTALEAKFRHEMKQWLRQGAITPVEHVFEGLESAPAAFCGLFEGRNQGKAVVHVLR